MKLSIIIPTRAESANLWFTLQGLLAQLRRHPPYADEVEIIVADNDPKVDPKGAKRIVGDLHNELIRYVHAGEIQSPYWPRDKGASEAQGEWICFLDSHVLMADDWLETVMKGIDGDYLTNSITHYPVVFNDPKIRWGHYLLRLDTDFWGTWKPRARVGEHYQIAATGIWAMTMPRCWYLDELRGFNKNFRGYSGGEPYLDMKTWCLGGSVWMDARTWGAHYSGPRGYGAGGWPVRIRNFAIAIEVLDPSRIGTFTDFYMQKVGGTKVTKAISEGIAAAQDEKAWFNSVRTRSLAEVLELFKAEGIPH